MRAHDRLIQKLAPLIDLDEMDRRALLNLPISVRSTRGRQDFAREGAHQAHCTLIVDGYVCRYKMLSDGKRQIMSVHVAGDIPDLQAIHLAAMNFSLGTIGSGEVALIGHGDLRDLMRVRPRVATALWRDTLIDASILRERVAKIGSRSASQRISHLLCELFVRQRAMGLADIGNFVVPLTQAELGDATGLSSVHVNRTIQHLRGLDLIASQGRQLQIANWVGLQREGDFHPAYLHLGATERSGRHLCLA